MNNQNAKKRAVKRTRNKNFNVRLTSEELIKLNKKIKKSTLPKADFLMAAAEGKKILLVENYNNLLFEMRKQGINLNTCTRSLNSILMLGKRNQEFGNKLISELQTTIKLIEDLSKTQEKMYSEIKNLEREIKENNNIFVNFEERREEKNASYEV